MTTVPFDTLKMMDVSERCSSKQDVAQQRSGVQSSIESLGTTLNLKIDGSAAEVKRELVRWVVSVGVLQMALIAALILKLTH